MTERDFGQSDGYQLGEGESQCQTGSHIQDSRESEPRRSTGSIPKFGDWLRTGLTERDFGQSDGYQLGEGESQCQTGSHIQDSRESEPRRSTGSIPKFGDWLRTGLTERDFGQSDGYQLEEGESQCQTGSHIRIHENDVRQTSAWRWMHG